MKAFLQNEIQLFFSRKNYLVWIVGALAVVFAYRFYYVTQYENYAQTVLEELEENAKDITIWESEYQRQCMELWGDNSAEKFAHASLLLNAWKQYEQTILDVPIFGCVIIGNRLGMRMEFAGRCWRKTKI